MTAIEIIRQFVEGDISPKEFEGRLYADPAVEALLKEEINLPSYVTEPDLYTYVISQDYLNLECIYNVQVLLSGALSKRRISHALEKKYERLLNLALKVQPRWVSLPSDYLSDLIEEQEKLSSKELKLWLKEKIRTDFRYLKAPPKWLQNPEWPIVGNTPMIFIGQLDISELSHDQAQAYLFLYEREKTFHTITQAC